MYTSPSYCFLKQQQDAIGAEDYNSPRGQPFFLSGCSRQKDSNSFENTEFTLSSFIIQILAQQPLKVNPPWQNLAPQNIKKKEKTPPISRLTLFPRIRQGEGGAWLDRVRQDENQLTRADASGRAFRKSCSARCSPCLHSLEPARGSKTRATLDSRARATKTTARRRRRRRVNVAITLRAIKGTCPRGRMARGGVSTDI